MMRNNNFFHFYFLILIIYTFDESLCMCFSKRIQRLFTYNDVYLIQIFTNLRWFINSFMLCILHVQTITRCPLSIRVLSQQWKLIIPIVL